MLKEFYFRINQQASHKRSFRQCRAMHIMAAIMLVFYTIPNLFSLQENWMYALGIGIPSLTILFIAIFKPQLIKDEHTNRIFRILEAGFLFMGCMHYLQENQNIPALLFGLVSFFMLFLLWMESRIFREQYLAFNQSRVDVNEGIRSKEYSWNELHAVMLQQDFITLSFKDHTIRQIKVFPDFTDFEAGDFLFFCQDCIRSSTEPAINTPVDELA